MSASMTQTITLQDGRKLGYTTYGVSAGKPVFYFSGGARLFGQLLHVTAAEAGARLIALDRPGLGISDFKPGRRISDWPSDVAELADALEVKRFAVVSQSAGAAYVAVCARQVPERLYGAAIVSGMCSFDMVNHLKNLPVAQRLTFDILRRAPLWLLQLLGAQTRFLLRRYPTYYLAQMSKQLPAPDNAVLADQATRQIVQESMLEAFQQGLRAYAWDMQLYVRPWGIRLEEITAPVYLWHGELDRNAPPAAARYMAQAIPDCRAVFYPDEGHMSVMAHHGQEILEQLTVTA